mmetsp:Transcript_5340/g.19532  ORF Transcript_5340/g.19532 Transcript_5340/m.19532 type:complete len:233 (-) Transcript_5340:312-1010(-)
MGAPQAIGTVKFSLRYMIAEANAVRVRSSFACLAQQKQVIVPVLTADETVCIRVGILKHLILWILRSSLECPRLYLVLHTSIDTVLSSDFSDHTKDCLAERTLRALLGPSGDALEAEVDIHAGALYFSSRHALVELCVANIAHDLLRGRTAFQVSFAPRGTAHGNLLFLLCFLPHGASTLILNLLTAFEWRVDVIDIGVAVTVELVWAGISHCGTRGGRARRIRSDRAFNSP